MLQAFEGYLEDNRIITKDPEVNLTGRHRVIVILLDESVPEKADNDQRSWLLVWLF